MWREAVVLQAVRWFSAWHWVWPSIRFSVPTLVRPLVRLWQVPYLCGVPDEWMLRPDVAYLDAGALVLADLLMLRRLGWESILWGRVAEGLAS